MGAGFGYRVLAHNLSLTGDKPVVPPIPLENFPMSIGSWSGKEVPLPEIIQRVAGNEAFLSRIYINSMNNEWVNIYVAYTSRPRSMLGHMPQVCYPAAGWICEGMEHTEIMTKAGKYVPCLLHRFHKPDPNYDEWVVLNFFVLNGQLTDDEASFTGLGWRTPNIKGNPARYVAQVQISSIVEKYVRTAGEEMTDLLMEFFPDEKGIIPVFKDFNKAGQ